MNDIEKLFKEKLAQHPVAPPPELWDKLEQARSPRKKKGGLLWMVAASVLLLLLSGLFLFNDQTTEPQKTLAVEAPGTPATEEPVMETVAPNALDSSKSPEQPEEKLPEPVRKPQQKETLPPTTVAQNQPEKAIERPEPLAKLEVIPSSETDVVKHIPTELPPRDLMAQAQTDKNRGLTIIYKSGQAEDKPEAEEQKPLEKAANFLANIKENGVGFSELRSAKSEIFSKAFSNKREPMSAE